MSSKTKIIFGVVGVGALLIGAYLLFFNSSSNTSAIDAQSNSASAAEVTFLDLASQIEPLTFDVTIFSDPRFSGLVDLHTAVLQEPVGRSDPFATLK
jgi:hypothetical protein